MAWEILFSAVALLLVFEGIMPFASPEYWRKMMLRMTSQTDKQIRFAGLISLILGAVLMYLVHAGVM